MSISLTLQFVCDITQPQQTKITQITEISGDDQLHYE